MLKRLIKWWRRRSAPEPKSYLKVAGCKVQILSGGPLDVLEIGPGGAVVKEDGSRLSVGPDVTYLAVEGGTLVVYGEARFTPPGATND